jgi:hypothetical protein
MRMAHLMTALVLLAAVTTARCESWILIGMSKEKNLYFDLDSIKTEKTHQGELVKLWSKTMFLKPKKGQNTAFEMKTLRRYDCFNETLAQLANVNYGFDLKVISSDFNEYRPNAIVPGSEGNMLLRNACSKDEREKSIKEIEDTLAFLETLKAPAR